MPHTHLPPASSTSPRSGYSPGAPALLVLLLAACLAGCSARRYEQAADKETYRILQAYEQRLFGHTNDFSIATQYSGREPELIPPDEIISGRTVTNRRVLNLEGALDLAVQMSREYQTQKEQLYLTALSLTGARYEFSPQFFANTEAAVSGSPSTRESGSLSTRIGVDQLLRTGGRLSVSLANDLVRYFTGWSSSPGNSSRDSAINLLSVTLSQPLLRGFGRNDPTVEALTQAERNVVYAIRTFTQFQREFATDIAVDFFELLRQKDAIRNNYTNFLRRVETTEYLRARAVDRQRENEVDDARNAELSARITYINSVAGYLNAVASFKLRLGIPITEELFLDDADLKELADAGLIPAEIDRNAAFRLAVQGHMDILNAIDRFEDTQRKVRLAADQLKPGILLSGTADLGSDEPYDYANFNLNEVRYSARLSIDFPVDRLRQRNNYRAALISFESQIRSLVQTLDSFKDRIDRGLRTLEQQRLNYLSRLSALEVADRRVEFSRLQLEFGRATLRDLREAQDALITAQNDLVFTAVGYLQARLQLLLDIGVARTEEEKFWLRDPLASVLTPEMRGPPPLHMPEDQLIPPDQFIEPRP